MQIVLITLICGFRNSQARRRRTRQSLSRMEILQRSDYATGVLVVKPLVQCLDLIHRELRIDVIDAYIWR